MKASEVIQELTNLMSENGDEDVTFTDGAVGWNATKVEVVTWYKDGFAENITFEFE